MSLLASVTAFQTERTDNETLLDAWDDTALTFELRKANEGGGLAVLDAQTLAALIEVQTTGRVGKGEPVARSPTDTDAALAGHVVDAWIAAMEVLAPDSVHRGWRTGARVASARAGKLVIDVGEYSVARVGLSLGETSRSGTLTLAVPLAQVPASTPQQAKPDKRSLMGVRTELSAVLCRINVNVGWLRDAKVDDVLTLPPGALSAVRVETEDGVPVARAQLGQSRGYKALRMALPPRVPQELLVASGEGVTIDAVANDPDAVPSEADGETPPGDDND